MVNMINKIASTIEMNFDIPESEKQEAKLASDTFKRVISALDTAKQHLKLMYDPFKDAGETTPEAVYEFRGAISRYKDQILKNFNKVKALSFLSIMHINNFASDTHVTELINGFKDSIEDVSDQVTVLCDAIDDIKNKDFKNNIVKAIDSVRKSCFETENMINERIIDYLNNNILKEDWVKNTGDELHQKIEEKKPYISILFEERQKAVGGP